MKQNGQKVYQKNRYRVTEQAVETQEVGLFMGKIECRKTQKSLQCQRTVLSQGFSEYGSPWDPLRDTHSLALSQQTC
jgi:hypothetical protein